MPKKSSKRSAMQLGITTFFILRIVFLPLLVVGVFFTGTLFALKPQQETKSPPCANSATCKSDLTQQVDNSATGIFEGEKVVPPKIDLSQLNAPTPVLGTTTGAKHIYIDLSNQTLYAYQGSELFLKTLVSTGKWNPTPDGNFHVWEKLVSTRMAGGSGPDAYDLPNVPYVMYFYSDYGLHGAYWHDNFGHPMSHGCVNMRQVDAKTLFNWADGPSGNTPGTPVSVCDKITMEHKCIQTNPLSS